MFWTFVYILGVFTNRLCPLPCTS